mgnify:CR=1 FL=1
MTLPYFGLTLGGRTPESNRNFRRGAACCGPPVGRRPARATRWVAGARPIRSEQDNSSPPAVSATSSDELQSAAWGGGELRGSVSRKSTANKFSLIA